MIVITWSPPKCVAPRLSTVDGIFFGSGQGGGQFIDWLKRGVKKGREAFVRERTEASVNSYRGGVMRRGKLNGDEGWD